MSADWSRGLDIAMLKGLAAVFKAEYKKHVYGAFGIPNERDIATAIDEGCLVKTREGDGVCIFVEYDRVEGRLKDFTGEVVKLPKGSVYIKAIAGAQKQKMLNHFIEHCESNPLFVEIFDEDLETRHEVESLGFEYLTTKITAASDLKGVYYRGWNSPYCLEGGEEISVKKVCSNFLSDEDLLLIRGELENSNWADHYSSYNKRQSWSAFCLRGYDPSDPNFIIKPGEMSQKWKKENADKMTWKSDWSELSRAFPITTRVVQSRFFGARPDRIRFMKLTSGRGELSRHADITDREAGIQPQKVVRLHIPIWTNPLVEFCSWTHRGEKSVVNMGPGELWYLDVRKPHTAINGGKEDRVHLVMDFYTNKELTNYICNQ